MRLLHSSSDTQARIDITWLSMLNEGHSKKNIIHISYLIDELGTQQKVNQDTSKVKFLRLNFKKVIFPLLGVESSFIDLLWLFTFADSQFRTGERCHLQVC